MVFLAKKGEYDHGKEYQSLHRKSARFNGYQKALMSIREPSERCGDEIIIIGRKRRRKN